MRRFLLGFIALLLVVGWSGGLLAAPLSTGGTIHVVQPGETLFSISLRYGVDVGTLARANGILNPSFIYVGQRLVIPSASASASAQAGVYVVQLGDTLYSIALRYGVTAWALAQANGLYDMNHIYVGQRLVIPGATVAPPAQPPASPAGASQGRSVTTTAWRGEYYAGTEPSGGPLFVRDERALNFHWGLSSPDPRLCCDEFSAHWTRTINFRGGIYRFSFTVDDGARLWIDGAIVLDAWEAGTERRYEIDLTLTPGQHLVAVDYFDQEGPATLQFSFQRLGDAPRSPTPTPVLVTPGVPATSTPAAGAAPPSDGWLGEYFGNPDLSGAPVVTRVDPAIGFEWKLTAPAGGIPDNHFSVRWTRRAFFYGDNYAFCATADDGVRIYVDGVLALDEWHGSNGSSYCKEVDLTEGQHEVRVEYYDDGGDATIYVWWDRH